MIHLFWPRWAGAIAFALNLFLNGENSGCLVGLKIEGLHCMENPSCRIRRHSCSARNQPRHGGSRNGSHFGHLSNSHVALTGQATLPVSTSIFHSPFGPFIGDREPRYGWSWLSRAFYHYSKDFPGAQRPSLVSQTFAQAGANRRADCIPGPSGSRASVHEHDGDQAGNQ